MGVTFFSLLFSKFKYMIVYIFINLMGCYMVTAMHLLHGCYVVFLPTKVVLLGAYMSCR